MQSELLNSISELIGNKRFYDPSDDWISNKCPLLKKFLEERTQCPIRFYRFYFTPPEGYLGVHTDGNIWNPSTISLNFPIANTENTKMLWYTTPEENMKHGIFGKAETKNVLELTSSVPKDLKLLKEIDSTVIDCPTFVRTDVLHSVENLNPTVRIVLSVRFKIFHVQHLNFIDVIKKIYKSEYLI